MFFESLNPYVLQGSDCEILDLSIFVLNVISNLCLNALYVIIYANKDYYYYYCISSILIYIINILVKV